MSVRVISTPLRVTAYLSGEIDHHSAAAIRDEIDMAVQKQCPQILRLDFGEVTFMDSSGVGLVMGRYRCVEPLGGKLEVTNLSEQIYKIMKLSGIETLAKISKKENVKK